MANRRKEIRELIVKTLLNQTIAEEKVFNFRIRPIQKENLFPCINVCNKEEKIEEVSSGQELFKRELDLSIRLCSFHFDDNNENIIDDMCSQVEKAMSGIKSDDFEFKLNNTEFFYDGLLTKMIIVCILNYTCTYYTKEVPEIKMDDLKSIGVQFKNG